MNEIITWVTQHNTIIIQVVFSIVLLLILVYIYRLFFANSPSAGGVDSSVELVEVNQKLDQLLDRQKNSGIEVIEKVVPTASGTDGQASADATAPVANSSELDQAKAENSKLKAQLNELEKKVFELTPIAGAENAAKDDSSKVDSAQLSELKKKIEELQSRLSEYDIIADDIAELSQLRTENAELKKKIENGGGDSSGSGTGASGSGGGSEEAPVSAQPGPASEMAPETLAEPALEVATNAAAEPTADIPSEKAEAVPEVTETQSEAVPGFDAETSALLESLVAETDTAAKAASEQTPEEPKLTMEQNIPEKEKNLINEFEKSIQKGS